jgi:hypothetical protein
VGRSAVRIYTDARGPSSKIKKKTLYPLFTILCRMKRGHQGDAQVMPPCWAWRVRKCTCRRLAGGAVSYYLLYSFMAHSKGPGGSCLLAFSRIFTHRLKTLHDLGVCSFKTCPKECPRRPRK